MWRIIWSAFLMCMCITSAWSQDVSSARSSSSELSPPDPMSLKVPSDTTPQVALDKEVAAVQGARAQNGTRPSLDIPRVSQPPKLEDFLEMHPNSEQAGQLTTARFFHQSFRASARPKRTTALRHLPSFRLPGGTPAGAHQAGW